MPDLMLATVTVPWQIAADFVRDYTTAGVLTDAAVSRGSAPRHNRKRLREAFLAADPSLPCTYEVAQAIKVLTEAGFIVTSSPPSETDAQVLGDAIQSTIDMKEAV